MAIDFSDVPVKSEFSRRFVEFLQAGLAQETIDSVNYNVVAYQEANGTVRVDRFVPDKREKMSAQYFRDRERAIMLNESDAQVIGQLNTFKAGNSLDMDEVAQGWFDYVVDGTAVQERATDKLREEIG